MKNAHLKNVLSIIVCIVLIAAMALSTFGCADNSKNSSKPEETKIYSQNKTPQSTDAENPEITNGEIPENSDNSTQEGTENNNSSTNDNGDIILGTGNKIFSFKVVYADKTTTSFEIHTDKTIVGDALQELGLIEGEEGTYGLYVKKVNGITVDYDTDGKYWAFYVNGDYASKGVDQTEINTSDIYSFEVN